MAADNPFPSATAREEVTRLLQVLGTGDSSALDRLTPLVYDELRGLARRQLAWERPDHTLQATALVHEAFVRLVGLNRIRLRDRAHFFALSARLMRQILVDHARRRHARKRVPAYDVGAGPGGLESGPGLDDLLDLDEALRVLAAESPRAVQVVECRFFGGMTVEETGEALAISPATVKREWQLARAWLNRMLA